VHARAAGQAIKELMAPAGTPRRKIGFQLPPAKA
jgi:hypothetical protein